MKIASNETGKIVGALLVGAVVGGALGVLFAPNKGSKTRKKILNKGKDVRDILHDKITAVVEQINPEKLEELDKKIK